MISIMKAVPCIVFCALIVAVPPARAGWPEDGVALCTMTTNECLPMIVSDGVGGAIVTWRDTRSGNMDIYAQRVDAWGIIQWEVDGIAVCTATEDQGGPKIVSDDAGGAIITWYDQRSGADGIYAQRVSASGEVQWTVNGVALCLRTGSRQWNPAIIADGAGGAVITWNDNRSGNYDIFAQRVDAAGDIQWTANGVALCTAAETQNGQQIVTDGAGGAIVTWADYRSTSGYDIYAQRVDAAGSIQWAADGIALCTATGDQDIPAIAFDGLGGAVVAWRDLRVGSFADVYAQRVDASGSVQWTTDGMAIAALTGFQHYPTIISDGASGVIIAWTDSRAGGSDIYAQKVDVSGAVQWAANGVVLCAATGNQLYPTIVSDGADGAIVTWHDGRSGDTDIYAQKVNGSGAIQWSIDGVALCAATGDQAYPAIASDGAGGAIVAFYDLRCGTNWDIYAQRVCEGVPPVATLLAAFSAAVEGSAVRVAWELSEPVEVSAFDVLRSNVGSEEFEEIPITIQSNGKAYSFIDTQCKPGSIVRYRVDIKESGVGRILFETDIVSVPVEPLALFQNAPNPFNPMTTLRYYLPTVCGVTLSIYDVSGRLVTTLIDGEKQDAGRHSLIWSGLDSQGRGIPSGVYFSVLTANKERLSKKMILLR